MRFITRLFRGLIAPNPAGLVNRPMPDETFDDVEETAYDLYLNDAVFNRDLDITERLYARSKTWVDSQQDSDLDWEAVAEINSLRRQNIDLLAKIIAKGIPPYGSE